VRALIARSDALIDSAEIPNTAVPRLCVPLAPGVQLGVGPVADVGGGRGHGHDQHYSNYQGSPQFQTHFSFYKCKTLRVLFIHKAKQLSMSFGRAASINTFVKPNNELRRLTSIQHVRVSTDAKPPQRHRYNILRNLS
jgi:hypothetical protein